VTRTQDPQQAAVVAFTLWTTVTKKLPRHSGSTSTQHQAGSHKPHSVESPSIALSISELLQSNSLALYCTILSATGDAIGFETYSRAPLLLKRLSSDANFGWAQFCEQKIDKSLKASIP
jgi:hypothetical protein